MREILFRGKSTDDQKWRFGDFARVQNPFRKDGNPITHMIVDGTTAFNWKVDPETVGQFTGLFDKNGKKIFEGDIFKFKDETWTSCYTSCGTEYDSYEVENYGVVGFEADYGAFDFVQYKFGENSVEADLHENHDLEFPDFVRGLEIVGNIYDNPELMEVESND